MSTSRTWPAVAVSSLRISPPESEHVDTWRRALVTALPTGSQKTIHDRTGIPMDTVNDACQGRHVRLPLLLAVEGLREIRPELRCSLADDLLAPLGLAVIQRPGESHDASGLLSANGALLVAVAAAQESLGEGLADGVMSSREALNVAAALSETRVRIDALLLALGVGR